MSFTWRETGIFARGLALGAAAATLLVTLNWPAEPGQGAMGMASASRPAQPALAQCPGQPAVEAAGTLDGRFSMPTRLAAYGPGDVGAFMAVGKEAAAELRMRDAEIAFLMACRVADEFTGASSPQALGARRQLALHYQDLIRDGSPAAPRATLEARLLALGPGSGPPLPARRPTIAMAQAAEEAAPQAGAPAPPQPQAQVSTPLPPEALQRPQVQALAPPQPPAARPQVATAQIVVTPRPAPAPADRPGRAPAAQPDRRVATASSALKARGVARAPSTAGCAQARSDAQRLICADAQLARMDREIGWLHARARSASHNGWAFARRSEEELQRRDTSCRDRACLLRWYAQRREQLRAEIDSV